MVDTEASQATTNSAANFTINLYPHPDTLGQALVELASHAAIQHTVVVYENIKDLVHLERMLESGPGVIEPRQQQQQQQQRQQPGSAYFQFVNLSNITRVEREFDGQRMNLVLARCNKETGLQFLETLMLKGLAGPEVRVVLPCLDLAPAHLRRYQYLGPEIILLQLDTQKNLDLGSMLFYDGLDTLCKSLASLQMTGRLQLPSSLSCFKTSNTSRPKKWEDGPALMTSLRTTSFLGESGTVSLDEEGQRSSFTLRVAELQFGEVFASGTWSPDQGYLRTVHPSLGRSKITGEAGRTEEEEGGVGQSLIVSTILSAPYTMEAEGNGASGDGRKYEGFAVDLMDEISQLVGFNYTLQLVSGYGALTDNGSWNGMIGEILADRADLAIADLTINAQREQVVDFSMPFLDLGISILFVSAPSKSINLFSFMTPLSVEVWLLMLVGGISVSVSLYLISRMTPFETAELEESEGQSPFFSLRHCFWFSVSSWVQQGCDFQPHAISTRTIASAWWFFTLIMISSYTANLAAFLTIERMDSPISSVKDLAKSDLKYGSVESGSTLSFFRDSPSPLYKKMYNKMSGWTDSLVQSNSQGIEKVQKEKGGYAFFMESVSIEYQTERNCKLTKVGENLDSKSYGVAMKKGSSLRSHITSAIIRLRQDGVLDRLKVKWWREERGGGACAEEEPAGGGVSRLTLQNLGGIFLVLLLGLILGGLVAVLEVLWVHCKKRNLLI